MTLKEEPLLSPLQKKPRPPCEVCKERPAVLCKVCADPYGYDKSLHFLKQEENELCTECSKRKALLCQKCADEYASSRSHEESMRLGPPKDDGIHNSPDYTSTPKDKYGKPPTSV